MPKRFATNRARIGRTRESVTLEGFADLDRQLRENLPKGTQRAVLRRAGNEAMEPMRDRAIELAPVRTGQTRDTIRIVTKFLKAKGRFGAAVMVQIAVGSRSVFWPKFQERGTVKMPPHPFVRPAFDSEAGPTLGRLKTALATEIHKAVGRRAARLAKKG